MSKQAYPDGRNFSKFDDWSTEALEEILRQDSNLPEGENHDTDLILYIMEVIAKREKHPTGDFSDVDAAWKTFNEKYRPYAGDGQSLYENEHPDIIELKSTETTPFTPANPTPAKRRGRGLLRVACVAAVIVGLAFAGTITSYALGYDLWGYVAQWSKETFGFVSEDPAPPSDSFSPQAQQEFTDLQSALDGHGITEKLVPQYIPEGYEQTEFYVDDTGNTLILAAVYTKNESTIIVDTTHGIESLVGRYQKDDIDPEIYETNGIEHHIMTNMGKYLAVWRNGNNEASISGVETKEELVMMIDSIYEEK